MKELKTENDNSPQKSNQQKREHELIKLYQETNDSQYFNALVAMHQNFIYQQAHKYHPLDTTFDKDDIKQEALIGFMKAIERFDLTKNYSLLTYAGYWINQNIQQSILKYGQTIRAPKEIQDLLAKYKLVIYKYLKEENRIPSLEEIAPELKVSVDKLKRILFSTKDLISLNQKITADENDELGDKIPDINQTPEEEVIQKFISQDLLKALNILQPIDVKILMLHYGLYDGKVRTLDEVGKIVGRTKQRVFIREHKALKKLKYCPHTSNLQSYLIEDYDEKKLTKKSRKG